MSLCVIMGVSGSGKSTLMEGLLAWDPKATLLTSTTTRAPKPGDLSDKDGRYQEYRYVTKEEFEALESEGAFAWPAGPHGNRYGTPRSILDEALSTKRLYIAALVWDAVVALKTYAAAHHPNAQISYVYLDLPDFKTREARIKERGDTLESRKIRLAELPWKRQIEKARLTCLIIDAARPKHEVLTEAIKYLAK
ncbi:MAG TPA: hypothetical protein VHD31_01730 [Candidatus Paceibacterota bacterium]|nr:hypothetical protein [Candidatus Paceibacterota bacterium]